MVWEGKLTLALYSPKVIGIILEIWREAARGSVQEGHISQSDQESDQWGQESQHLVPSECVEEGGPELDEILHLVPSTPGSSAIC